MKEKIISAVRKQLKDYIENGCEYIVDTPDEMSGENGLLVRVKDHKFMDFIEYGFTEFKVEEITINADKAIKAIAFEKTEGELNFYAGNVSFTVSFKDSKRIKIWFSNTDEDIDPVKWFNEYIKNVANLETEYHNKYMYVGDMEYQYGHIGAELVDIEEYDSCEPIYSNNQ